MVEYNGFFLFVIFWVVLFNELFDNFNRENTIITIVQLAIAVFDIESKPMIVRKINLGLRYSGYESGLS